MGGEISIKYVRACRTEARRSARLALGHGGGKPETCTNGRQRAGCRVAGRGWVRRLRAHAGAAKPKGPLPCARRTRRRRALVARLQTSYSKAITPVPTTVRLQVVGRWYLETTTAPGQLALFGSLKCEILLPADEVARWLK